MNDLIERLKPYLQGMRVYADIPTTQIPIELLEKTITALREQEIINKLHPTKTKLRARIAELEAAEERSAEYLAESVENEVEALEEIKRLDAALKEISLGAVAPMDFAKKARAGDD
jgi:hypothetical protein